MAVWKNMEKDEFIVGCFKVIQRYVGMDVEVKDSDTFISIHRSGDYIIVQGFRKDEKIGANEIFRVVLTVWGKVKEVSVGGTTNFK